MLKSRARFLFFSLNRTLFGSFPQTKYSQFRFEIHKGFKRIATSELGKCSLVMAAGRGEEVELLSAVNDHHGGVIVEMKDRIDAGTFVRSLRASLDDWRQKGIRGVWIKLPIELANLVQPAVEEGFWYHHAEPSYLMLVYWIPDTAHTLPVNATHRVGVGAFVINDKKEVLVVQEKTGILRGLGIWKFPTGVVEQGEDIFSGAIREVKEETGIDTEFVEVLAFRQTHMAFFEKSDLFFVCMLRPLSFDIQKQESEIEAAQWMPIQEYAAQPFIHKHDLLKYIVDVGLAKLERDYSGFSPLCIKSAFSDGQSYLYINSRDLNKSSGSAPGDLVIEEPFTEPSLFEDQIANTFADQVGEDQLG